MKCNRLAVYGWKTKKGMVRPSRILYSIENDNVGFVGFIFDRLEKCEGEIESQIELEFTPYYGGADPSIEVRFRCKKCGYNFGNENGLPYDVYTLNKFLTEVISKL